MGVYEPLATPWANGPDGGTPLNADRLGHMEQGIIAVDTALEGATDVLQGLVDAVTGVAVIAESGAAQELDFADAVVDLTLDANCTVTFTGATNGVLSTLLVVVRQDADGNHTLTATGVLWPSGSAPAITTAAESIDVLRFITLDGGTTIFGEVVGQDMS